MLLSIASFISTTTKIFLSILLAFCEPAEAHLIEIRLRETEPRDGRTCAAVDAIFQFNDMIAELLLPVGTVIPANCTINRLIDYSCEERFKFCRNTRGTGTRGPGTRGTRTRGNRADVRIRTLILCNACTVVPAGLVQVPSPVYDSGIINEAELETNLGIGDLDFSVQVVERTTKRKTRSHSTRKTYSSGCFLCGENFVSPFDAVQCGKYFEILHANVCVHITTYLFLILFNFPNTVCPTECP